MFCFRRGMWGLNSNIVNTGDVNISGTLQAFIEAFTVVVSMQCLKVALSIIWNIVKSFEWLQ